MEGESIGSWLTDPAGTSVEALAVDDFFAPEVFSASDLTDEDIAATLAHFSGRDFSSMTPPPQPEPAASCTLGLRNPGFRSFSMNDLQSLQDASSPSYAPQQFYPPAGTQQQAANSFYGHRMPYVKPTLESVPEGAPSQGGPLPPLTSSIPPPGIRPMMPQLPPLSSQACMAVAAAAAQPGGFAACSPQDDASIAPAPAPMVAPGGLRTVASAGSLSTMMEGTLQIKQEVENFASSLDAAAGAPVPQSLVPGHNGAHHAMGMPPPVLAPHMPGHGSLQGVGYNPHAGYGHQAMMAQQCSMPASANPQAAMMPQAYGTTPPMGSYMDSQAMQGMSHQAYVRPPDGSMGMQGMLPPTYMYHGMPHTHQLPPAAPTNSDEGPTVSGGGAGDTSNMQQQPAKPGGLRKSQSALELGAWRTQSFGPDKAESLLEGDESNKLVGRLTPEERLQRIMRYRQKRDKRNFNREIKYQCRKTLADSRPRVGGRFARNEDPNAVMPHQTKKAMKMQRNGSCPAPMPTASGSGGGAADATAGGGQQGGSSEGTGGQSAAQGGTVATAPVQANGVRAGAAHSSSSTTSTTTSSDKQSATSAGTAAAAAAAAAASSVGPALHVQPVGAAAALQQPAAGPSMIYQPAHQQQHGMVYGFGMQQGMMAPNGAMYYGMQHGSMAMPMLPGQPNGMAAVESMQLQLQQQQHAAQQQMHAAAAGAAQQGQQQGSGIMGQPQNGKDGKLDGHLIDALFTKMEADMAVEASNDARTSCNGGDSTMADS